MSESKRKGRPPRNEARQRPTAGAQAKPTASTQLEPEERERLESICNETGRSLSYVLRAAVLLLLKEQIAGRLDWAKSPDTDDFIKRFSCV